MKNTLEQVASYGGQRLKPRPLGGNLYSFLLFLVVACAFCEIAAADPERLPTGRTATIIDSSGTATEVTDFRFDDDQTIFGSDGIPTGARFNIHTKTFEIGAIEPSEVISIEAKEKDFEIKYIGELGKECVLDGKIGKHIFRGKTTFGEFTLESDKLKNLKIHEIPVPKKFKSGITYDTTVTLVDGVKIRVGELKRLSFSERREMVGSGLNTPQGRVMPTDSIVMRVDHPSSDISIFLGEAQISVEFNTIYSLKLHYSEMGAEWVYAQTISFAETGFGSRGRRGAARL